jgi:hypothetical protein
MQLQLWFCHSEISRRLNKCADALQVTRAHGNMRCAHNAFCPAFKHCRGPLFGNRIQSSPSFAHAGAFKYRPFDICVVTISFSRCIWLRLVVSRHLVV